MTWDIRAPQGNELFKCRWEIVQYTRGRGLDIGCGPNKTFSHFIGVDNGVDQKLYNIPIRPDVWINDAGDLSVFTSQTMDFCVSSHLLEHVEFDRVPAVLKEWWRVLKVGGYLTLYLPSEDDYPKVGEAGANPDHKWNVSRAKVLEAMDALSWDLVEYQRRNEDNEYSLLFVFRKATRGHAFTCDKPKPEKTVGVVRYGAFGDAMQCSSILAGLKKQGYHTTLYCSPPGSDVLTHDPNLDVMHLQDKDQVPNAHLKDFWDYHAKKFDKWVNLSESVEGSLLAIPDRTQHWWPPAVRHRYTNINYLEFQHQIAGVPHDPQVHFFATVEEKAWARERRSRMGEFVLMWSLSGSSVHKTWAGLDRTIAALLIDFPDLEVVLVGGMDGVILEQGWENERRVHKRSGKWSIRQTLAFLAQADMVIGPETGVMNAACQMDLPKVIFLSHSTEENLTRDWVNTHVLRSENTVCPGRGNNEAPACHQMHYNWAHCKKSSESTAQCMTDIDGELAYKKIWHAVQYERERKVA